MSTQKIEAEEWTPEQEAEFNARYKAAETKANALRWAMLAPAIESNRDEMVFPIHPDEMEEMFTIDPTLSMRTSWMQECAAATVTWVPDESGKQSMALVKFYIAKTQFYVIESETGWKYDPA